MTDRIVSITDFTGSINASIKTSRISSITRRVDTPSTHRVEAAWASPPEDGGSLTPEALVLDGAPSALSSSPAEPSHVPIASSLDRPRSDPGPRGVVRRLGRGSLRLFKPLLLPVLHRMEWRIRTAVDRTATSERVCRLGEQLDRQDELIRRLLDEQGVAASRQAEIAADLAWLVRTSLENGAKADPGPQLVRLSTMLEVIYARLPGASLSRQGSGLAEQLERLREQVGSVADRQSELTGEVLEHVTQAGDASSLRIVDRIDASAANAGVKLDEMLTYGQALLRGSEADRVVSATILDRATASLQRCVIVIGPDVLVRTTHGWLLAPEDDEALVTAMVEANGLLEPGTTSVAVALLEPGDTMVDVGAHVGTITIPCAQAVGLTGRVHAVEPTPRSADLLERSVRMHGLASTVMLHRCAAGDASGTAELALSPIVSHNSLLSLDEAVGYITVDVRPVDALVPPGTQVRLLKIDAEGMEIPVWRGAQRVLAESPRLAAILEFGPSHLARSGISVSEWLIELTRPGFTPYEIDEVTGTLRPLRSAGLEDVYSLNLLLLRGDVGDYPALSVASA